MNDDLETQPLVQHQSNETATAPTEISEERHGRLPSGVKLSAISLAIFALIIVVIAGIRLSHNLPSEQDIEDSVLSVSNWKVQKVHLDGWTNGHDLNNEGGKALQITMELDYWIDYDSWLQANDTELSHSEKKRYRFVSERLVRNACFAVNNLTTFDGEINNNNTVGSLSVHQPICIDLHNNISTRLNLTLYLEPNMDNIFRVLKKIWRHQYDELDLSSVVDVTLSKQATFFAYQWGFPLARLRNLQVNWKSIIDWNDITPTLGQLRHHLNQLTIKRLFVTDSVNGFRVHAEAELVEKIELLEWIELPQDSIFPLINWELKIQDCNNEYSIELPNAFCFTDAFKISDAPKLSAYSDIEGPLPDSLLSDVCWSDEENAITPMTNLLNKIFNGTELITMEVKGHTTTMGNDDLKSIIPLDILDKALSKISFFPIGTNFTLNSDTLIQDVTINGLKIKWVTSFLGEKRLSIAGKVVALISLPFYETNKNRLMIQHIKGDSRLYHDGKHFVTIPMKYWSRASSRIFRDEEIGTAVIEVSFDIKDDEVQVVNSVELTRVLNEILLKGKAIVDLSSNLDVLLTSPLGEMALMGLKGKGKALVRS
ncbi:hypothetical protein HG535_0B04500 [Zygotorulaspora mrakii]|uniref:Uncharacterized protein n=1 Tax=Zygotorulaspora mrakii TaxID=42260 RepID=A0A7H9AYC4_ZYGMR|nr:uncharacterized protein HG535_0B04500 [Zygotorulaspora mrakii]QLG71408.1 hypothetical protein HG535_0B04500 [Zygotorulaspora mrakii]